MNKFNRNEKGAVIESIITRITPVIKKVITEEIDMGQVVSAQDRHDIIKNRNAERERYEAQNYSKRIHHLRKCIYEIEDKYGPDAADGITLKIRELKKEAVYEVDEKGINEAKSLDFEEFKAKRPDGYYKQTADAVKLSDGTFIEINKQGIQTTFWFGERGDDFEEKTKSAKSMYDNDKFVNYNISHSEYLSTLEQLKRNQLAYVVNTDEKDRYNFGNGYLILIVDGNSRNKTYSDTEVQSAIDFYNKYPSIKYINPKTQEIRMLTDEDRKRLIERYEKLEANFEARVKSYVNRYGTSKVRSSTYWLDR